MVRSALTSLHIAFFELDPVPPVHHYGTTIAQASSIGKTLRAESRLSYKRVDEPRALVDCPVRSGILGCRKC